MKKITLQQWAELTGSISAEIIVSDLPTSEYNQLMRDYQKDELAHMSKVDYLYNLLGNALGTGELDLLASVKEDDYREMVDMIDTNAIKYGLMLNDKTQKIVEYAMSHYCNENDFQTVLSVIEMRDRVVDELKPLKEDIKCVELMQNIVTEEHALWVELNNGYAFQQRLKHFTDEKDSWAIAEELYSRVSSAL